MRITVGLCAAALLGGLALSVPPAAAATVISPGLAPAPAAAPIAEPAAWVCGPTRCNWVPGPPRRPPPPWARGWGPPPRPGCFWVRQARPFGPPVWVRVCR